MTWKIPATPKSARSLKRVMANGTSIIGMEKILARQMANHKSPFAPVREFTRDEMMKLSQMSEDEAANSVWAQPLPKEHP